MEICSTQKTAKQWAKALVKLNSAEPGTVQICYQDEEGNKQVGFIDIFKMEIAFDGSKMAFGAFLSNMDDNIRKNTETLANALADAENMRLELNQAKKDIEEIKSCIPGLTAL